MKKIQAIRSLFSKVKGAKGAKAEKKVEISNVIVSSYSQPYVLQQRMKEEKLSHGQTVEANIDQVRFEAAGIDSQGNRRMVMYFCPMGKIEVTKNITAGDGGSLPDEATIENIVLPKEALRGLYSVKDVILSSNGTLQMKATRKTKFEFIG